MNDKQAKYFPISCEFHDFLESFATSRKSVRICYRDSGGATQYRDTEITDVFAREGAEYLTMATGEALRLDQVVDVDGVRLADYS